MAPYGRVGPNWVTWRERWVGSAGGGLVSFPTSLHLISDLNVGETPPQNDVAEALVRNFPSRPIFDSKDRGEVGIICGM